MNKRREYLRLRKDSINTIGELSPEVRQKALIAFTELITDLHKYSCGQIEWKLEEGLRDHQYPFGEFNSGFLFPTRGEGIFEGISHVVYDLYISKLSISPSLGKEIKDLDWEGLTEYKSDYGLSSSDSPEEIETWLTREEDWQEGRVEYYRRNPNQIDWSRSRFLPNIGWSNRILSKICTQEGIPFSESNFHEMLGQKGSEKEASIKEYGEQICLANFYTFNRDLSLKEKKRTGKKDAYMKSRLKTDNYIYH